MATVAELVRENRLKMGLSLRDYARQAEVSHSFIADIEAGRGNPTIDTLERLAGALGMQLVVEFAEIRGRQGTGHTNCSVSERR